MLATGGFWAGLAAGVLAGAAVLVGAAAVGAGFVAAGGDDSLLPFDAATVSELGSGE